ncbi:MAG: tetratricopeptide repeat protein [Proteobacteria bacterium]|nr:tetratricopeptide repeat protein [Pseudomonadota bacterium]
MTISNLKLRLLNRLHAAGQPASAIGIDLGTTKSCLAVAKYDPKANTLDCQCVEFERPDGTRNLAVPSAVAQVGGRRLFGAAALAQRSAPGLCANRDWFYEAKNLIGLRYTYKDAPAGLGNAGEVAAALIGHLHEEARLPQTVLPPLVVTVPASFHAAQREATISAAERGSGLPIRSGKVRLLDEPYAAFVDLKFREPARADALLREGANVLVFDFGGGTCDVAIFRVDTVRGGTLGARLVGTSRYHRLGGGDIDRAIVHDVLVPQLLKQHGLKDFDVTWDTRTNELEGQLLDVAERLKRALSTRLADYFGANTAPAPELSVASVDLDVTCEGRRLAFARPSLDVAAFDKLLVPFLDPEPVPEAGDEFVLRNSIFAPILQALTRAKLEREDLHGVLLCGSSSLMAPVQKALRKFLPKADHVLLGTPDDLQAAVARGAALQALSLQVLGQPIVAPVCSSAVSLKLAEGAAEMCRAGDAVPGAAVEPILLRPPHARHARGVDIAVEVLTDGKRLVGRSLWHLPPPVRADERLELTWSMDENQCIELHLARPDDARTESFVKRFDAPLMHRDLSQLVRCRALEREERLRRDEIPHARLGDEYEQHAWDCASLGEYQKALYYLSLALQELGESDYRLNLRGIWRQRIGDRDGARDSYERAGNWSTAKFNLALLHHRNGQYDEALREIRAAIDKDGGERAYRVLHGDILDKLGDRDTARSHWQDALDGQLNLKALDDFALAWLEGAANKLGHESLLKRIKERRRKITLRVAAGSQQGELPVLYDDPGRAQDEVAA